MPAANDIFISYAWADNAPPAGAVSPETDRWVWQFESALTAALRSKLGTSLNVWLDRRMLRANEVIKGVLTEELRQSKLLVVLMSPSWSASTWCRLELEAYLAEHAGSSRQEGVFVVEIEPVPRSAWHERIRDLAAFPFHKPLAHGRGSVRLGYPLPDPRLDRDFYLDLVTLADDIAAALQAAPAAAVVSATAATAATSATPAAPASAAQVEVPGAASSPPERVVWIADPTDDLQRKRRELHDAIRQAGYEVRMPSLDAMLRGGAGPVERQIEHSLAGAGLFVQLLGPHAGRLADDGRSWAQVQSELAHAAAGRGGWPFLSWRAPGTSLEEDEETHRLLLAGAMEQGFEELRRDVLRRLPVQRTPPPAPRGPSARPSICITCSEEDLKLGDEVVRMLDDLDVFYLEFIDGAGADAQAAPDRAEDKALSESNGVVIVYGAADANWLVTKVQRANQLRGRRESLWGALIDAPVAGKRPAPRARAIERHDWTGGPDFARMRHFVESIAGAGTGAPHV